MKLTENQKRILFISSSSAVAIWLIHFSIVEKLSFWNLSGLLIGGTALSLSIEDRRNKNNAKAFENISNSIEQSKAQTIKEMQRNDFAHDQRMIELATKIGFLEMALKLHTEEIGHKEMLKQLFGLKQEMGDLSAHMAFNTKEGVTEHQLEQIKADASRQIKADAVRFEAITERLEAVITAIALPVASIASSAASIVTSLPG